MLSTSKKIVQVKQKCVIRNGSAFRKAKQEGWIYDYTWFNTPHMVDKSHFCVYSYEDKEKI